MAFELGLNKLPWKAQVGLFLVVAVAAVGGFYWYYVQDVQAALATEQARLDAMKVEINKGLATARQLPEFQQQVGELQARLDLLRAVLPEEKDVSDLLRRLQTLATESNLQIKGFKPAGDRHEADACRVADHPRARWDLSQSRTVLRSRQQVPANHQRHRRHHQEQGKAAAGIDHQRRVRGDHLRVDRSTRQAGGRCARCAGAAKVS